MRRRILVTGSSRGIGAAITKSLLALGHEVTGMSRTKRDYGSGFRQLCTDLSQPTIAVKELKDIGSIDGLICAAGAPCFGHLEQFNLQTLEESLRLNLVSHMAVVQKLLPALKREPHSNIVFVGSESALRGGPQGTLYSAAKFGLRGFALALRKEVAKSGVHVSIINPGMVRTGWFDELRFGPGEGPDQAIEAEDVAALVMGILASRPGTVVDEINLSPQNHVIRFDKK